MEAAGESRKAAAGGSVLRGGPGHCRGRACSAPGPSTAPASLRLLLHPLLPTLAIGDLALGPGALPMSTTGAAGGGAALAAAAAAGLCYMYCARRAQHEGKNAQFVPEPEPGAQFVPEPEPEPESEPAQPHAQELEVEPSQLRDEETIDSLAVLYTSGDISRAELDWLAEARAVRLALRLLPQVADDCADSAIHDMVGDLADCLDRLRERTSSERRALAVEGKRPTVELNAILDLAAGPLLDTAAVCPSLGLWGCRILEMVPASELAVNDRLMSWGFPAGVVWPRNADEQWDGTAMDKNMDDRCIQWSAWDHDARPLERSPFFGIGHALSVPPPGNKNGKARSARQNKQSKKAAALAVVAAAAVLLKMTQSAGCCVHNIAVAIVRYPDGPLLAGIRHAILQAPAPAATRVLLAMLHLRCTPRHAEQLGSVLTGIVEEAVRERSQPIIRALSALLLHADADGTVAGLTKTEAEKMIAKGLRAGQQKVAVPKAEGREIAWAFDFEDPGRSLLLLEGGLTTGAAAELALKRLTSPAYNKLQR